MRDRRRSSFRSDHRRGPRNGGAPTQDWDGPSSPVRRDLVRLIRLLVDHPDEIDVREGRGNSETFFKVRLAPEDLGKVIGRQGRTARALRSLLEVRGAHEGRRYGLEIREA